MRGFITQLLIRLVLLTALGLNVGCALRVKVREDWDAAKRTEVPLEEASVTWQQIRKGQLPAPEQLEQYNAAVRDSVVQIGANWAADRPLSLVKTEGGEIQIELSADKVLSHQQIDQIMPADYVKVKRGFDSDVVVEGVGAPLMVRQPRTEQNPMVPESGLWFPVTAVLNLDSPSNPVLEFIDPTRQRTLPFGNSKLPLAADYTATFARDFYDRQRLIPNTGALLKFEKFAGRMGLHRVSAFDPDKQVCILVHGIYSSPSTWEITINEFYKDPELRERFEFWSFGYPTGALIPYLSAEFRDAIHEMQAFRRREGARDESLVIVGHSMGGLLAKSMTQSGGDEDWNKLFKVPIEDLRVSSEYRETLRSLVYYEPVPGIEKVIFCSTPHRGSRVAGMPGGQLVGALIQVPVNLAQAGSEILNDAERSLTPLGWEIAKGNISSLNQLRPGSPLAEGHLAKPLNPSVRYFSLIGSKKEAGKQVPLDEVTDGVVVYSSAHIEGVEEEVIIYGVPHGLHREPGGVAEISRLLKLP